MTTSGNEAVADHVNQARDFLARSREYLTQGDLHQVSEKGWGAAAHMVKAVAIAQGWEYERHSDFSQVLNLGFTYLTSRISCSATPSCKASNKGLACLDGFGGHGDVPTNIRRNNATLTLTVLYRAYLTFNYIEFRYRS